MIRLNHVIPSKSRDAWKNVNSYCWILVYKIIRLLYGLWL